MIYYSIGRIYNCHLRIAINAIFIKSILNYLQYNFPIESQIKLNTNI